VRYLVGFGNYTSCDDSIGLRIVEYVAERGLEQGFRALDLSTNSLNLVSYLNADTEAILIVDSAKMGMAPGETRCFTPEEVESRKEPGHLSTHEGDVLKVLELARAMGYPAPPIMIMGIEPERVTSGIGLSKTLEERLPAYAASAIARLLDL
jgi:hydrogenase maturation protease